VTEGELRDLVLLALRKIAPEADPREINWRESLRDQLDIDSMDFLNFLIALHETLGVDIPEADYPRLSTLQAIVEYLAQKSAAPAAGRAAPSSSSSTIP
jgi:acyl carrier protein